MELLDVQGNIVETIAPDLAIDLVDAIEWNTNISWMNKGLMKETYCLWFSCYQDNSLIQIASMLTIAAIMPAIKTKLENLKTSLQDAIEKLKKAPDYKEVPGGCFVAGTLIATAHGMVPIEKVCAGDYVQIFDPVTQEVSQKLIEETFVHESSELIHVNVGKEIISTTPNHPFYVVGNGFVRADNHTYFFGEAGIGVHNAECADSGSKTGNIVNNSDIYNI